MWICKKCGEEVGIRIGTLYKLDSKKETTGDDLSFYDNEFYECSHCHNNSYSNLEEIATWEDGNVER
ncbi:MAG: hypothetical protein ACTTJX_04855 [Fusobacterium sp.]|uniref:hypothetical protein n=1 Tax=Fusobacterium sp. TaxID=68766 RepID=UPI003FA0AAB8